MSESATAKRVKLDNNSNNNSNNNNNVPLRSGSGFRSGGAPIAPTVKQIEADALTQLAAEHWGGGRSSTAKAKEETPSSSSSSSSSSSFDPAVVEAIFRDELVASAFALPRLVLLEFSQYLERYLWPNFDAETASVAHVISIVLMVNEKFRERVPAWDTFRETEGEKFSRFFRRVLEENLSAAHSFKIRTFLLVFLINCFQSLENTLIRKECSRLVSLGCWHSLLEERRNKELKQLARAKTMWKQLQKLYQQSHVEQQKKQMFERTYLSRLLQQYLYLVSGITEAGSLTQDQVRYCDRFVEFLIDLEAQLPTRRYFNTLLDDHQVVAISLKSKLNLRPEGQLFKRLLETLKFYARFEINDHTGVALTESQMTDQHYQNLIDLQRTAFLDFPAELHDLTLSHLSAIELRKNLTSFLGKLSDDQLAGFCTSLGLRNSSILHPDTRHSKEFLLDILVQRFERRPSQLDAINNMPLYPDESVLWDDTMVTTEYYAGEHCLALPKLNLQFLTIHDYLLRNFDLFRLESSYQIREDIEDAVRRVGAIRTPDQKKLLFRGWSKMAVPMTNFTIVDVTKPDLGETRPGMVRADVTFSISRFPEQVRREWESLRQHDVVFLLTLRPTEQAVNRFDFASRTSIKHFQDHFGITYVRGCEVQDILGPDGKPVDDFRRSQEDIKWRNDSRTFRVLLDTNQYQMDMDRHLNETKEDVYSTFNLLVRRKAKENNFKAVLETIRDLMQTELVVPDWLHDVFLGYGDPASAHYSKFLKDEVTLDFNDTFLSMEHLQESFPNLQVIQSPKATATSPFKIKFNNKNQSLEVLPYTPPNRGPYPFNQPKKNAVRFTPIQVEAIKAGMNVGLTLVVGPPGTGKTDVAVQVVSNLYHSFPNQHILLIMHSNQALNQIFEKIIDLDIDERHCLRLGHGVEEVQTEKDFSRYGRVDYFLEKRMQLLGEVDRLAYSLNIAGDHGHTCETASYFFLNQVMPRWEKFQEKLAGLAKPSGKDVEEHFPFKDYFADAPQPLFPPDASYPTAVEIANGCFSGHLKGVFNQLNEMRAFELLRTGRDRANYLLTKEAKIIAMTCTHAALKRRELVSLNFKYDTVVMEEAAQILEVETFVPLLLQNPEDGHNRLKRVVMIGDHNQLPPVVQNMAFQRYANMEQSLFSRFVRLGVPYVQLDAQGRARTSLRELYSWKYAALGDLPIIQQNELYAKANAGFAFDYQVLNVEDWEGRGETSPDPFYYQNVGEAEYVVAVYQYMRLIGYPAEKIAVLTTYNGQKDLLREMFHQRCSWHPLFGRPSQISTVDKFQGQQNDYILLSLVRTKAIGHLRDVRRLIVAMSRARLGLYIFCRVSLFENCYELTPSFSKLLQRPQSLQLVLGETHPAERMLTDSPSESALHSIEDVHAMIGFVSQMTQEQMSRLEQLKNAAAAEDSTSSSTAMEQDSDNANDKKEEDDRDKQEEDPADK